MLTDMRRALARVPRRDCILPVFVAAVLLSPRAATAVQVVMRVDSAVSCATCRIEIESVVALKGPFDNESVVDVAWNVKRDSAGRIYVYYDGTYVDIHARDGSYTGLRIGAPGQGPGEFRTIGNLEVGSGVVRVYDPGLQRSTEFDMRTRAAIETVRLPTHFNSIRLDDGRYVLAGPVRTREAAGYPLHVFDGSGNWQRSFGSDEAVLRPDYEVLLLRTVHAAGGGRFWAAPTNEYRLELWNPDGWLEKVLVAHRSWFRPWTEQRRSSSEAPPQPVLARLSADAEGLLWVIVGVPSENWADALSDERDIMGNPRLIPNRPYMDAVVEVLDPAEGTVVARRRFPFFNTGFASENVLWHSWVGSDGWPHVELVELSVTGR